MGKGKKRIIKRYSNRKLYDTALKQFTTLDELSRLLDSGVSFEVRDHDSGKDRTDEVLAQVLGRRARGGHGSTDLLAGLLRTPANVALELAGGISPQRPVEPPAPAKDRSPGKSKKGQKAKAGKPAKSGSPEPGELERQREEIRELRSQVAELTKAVQLLVEDRVAERERTDGRQQG